MKHIDLSNDSPDYQEGFRAGMEYQERVEIDLLEALQQIERGEYCEGEEREIARAAIDKATSAGQEGGAA
jgi:hypothetical protein